MIRKSITSFLMAIMFAVTIPALAGTVSAQRRGNDRRYDRYDNRYDDRYTNEDYNDNGEYKRPNVYDRHRKAINIGVATGAGAIIGALIGGKKGALIGAAAGVATGAIITRKQRPRNYERIY
jgi:hypothetical protein